MLFLNCMTIVCCSDVVWATEYLKISIYALKSLFETIWRQISAEVDIGKIKLFPGNVLKFAPVLTIGLDNATLWKLFVFIFKFFYFYPSLYLFHLISGFIYIFLILKSIVWILQFSYPNFKVWPNSLWHYLKNNKYKSST